MNDKRRAKANEVVRSLGAALALIEDLLDDEQAALEGIPENMQERVERCEDTVAALEDAKSSLEEAVSRLEEAAGR